MIFMQASIGAFAYPITAKNIIGIKYESKDGNGTFTANANGTWTQQDAQGNKLYKEFSRLDWVVHLVEHNTTTDTLINLQHMKVFSYADRREKKYNIVEVTGSNQIVATHVDAPPARNCGGLGQAPCLDQNLRCDVGLFEHYGYQPACDYSHAKRYELSQGEPVPVVYPVLDPSNHEHVKLLARKIQITLTPPFGDLILKLTATGSDTIYSLERLYEKRYKQKQGSIRLGLVNNTNHYNLGPGVIPLDEKLTLAHYDIKSGSTIYVDVPNKCEAAGCNMTVAVYPITGLTERHRAGFMHIDRSKASDTVAQFRKLARLDADTVLMFEDQVLDDNRTLGSYNIGGIGGKTGDMRGIYYVGAIYRNKLPGPPPAINGANVKELVHAGTVYCFQCPVAGVFRDLGNKQWTQTATMTANTTTKNMTYTLVEQQRDVDRIVLFDASRNATVTIKFTWLDEDSVTIYTSIPGKRGDEFEVMSRK